MLYLYKGRDIAIVILRTVYSQDYSTAVTNRIARCVRSELVYKYPEYLLTDMFSIYLRLLNKAGLFNNGDYRKYSVLQRERLHKEYNIYNLKESKSWEGYLKMVERRVVFEASTMHEAKRRRLECLNGEPEELVRRRKHDELYSR